MTPSDLKYHVEQSGSNPYYFTRKTMKFFGDSMRNYGVRSEVVFDRQGNKRYVWELYRKHAVKHGLQSSHFFDKETFEQVYIP